MLAEQADLNEVHDICISERQGRSSPGREPCGAAEESPLPSLLCSSSALVAFSCCLRVPVSSSAGHSYSLSISISLQSWVSPPASLHTVRLVSTALQAVPTTHLSSVSSLFEMFFTSDCPQTHHVAEGGVEPGISCLDLVRLGITGVHSQSSGIFSFVCLFDFSMCGIVGKGMSL